MSDAQSNLAEWFEEFFDEKLPVEGHADLFGRFGIEGDDAFEFMDAFVARFQVASDNYRWYFHHGEEGCNLFAPFFPPPYRRVKRLPITPDILVQAIEAKRWPVQYPPHELPKVRWDIRLGQMMLLVPLGWAALWLWQRLVG